jgi:hypothetical protein
VLSGSTRAQQPDIAKGTLAEAVHDERPLQARLHHNVGSMEGGSVVVERDTRVSQGNRRYELGRRFIHLAVNDENLPRAKRHFRCATRVCSHVFSPGCGKAIYI